MSEVKRHLYYGEDYQLFVEGSKEWDNALKCGWTRTKHEQAKEDIEGPYNDDVPTLFEEGTMLYRNTARLEVLGVYDNGDPFVQNEGDDSDKWRIPKETFEATYELCEPAKSADDLDADASQEDIDGATSLPEKEEEIIIDGEQDNEEEGPIDLTALSEEELRQVAKEEGIKNWHNKKPENIIKELMEMTE